MKKHHYESVVIINAALEDDQIEATISNIQSHITSHGGEILELDKWGRKRLAYPIDKAKSGYYLVTRFFAPTNLIATLERSYRLDETIIRYLTVTLDKFALEAIDKQKEASLNAAQAAEQEATAAAVNNDSEKI